jgi:phosphate transport system permease protein
MATVTGPTALTPASEALRGRRLHPGQGAFRVALLSSVLISLVVLGVLVADVVRDSLPVFRDRGMDFLRNGLSRSALSAGVAQGIQGSLLLALTIAVVAFPIGIGAAVYLEEYAREGQFTNLMNVAIRNLAGVPSIVYGILGLAIFVQALREFTGPGAVGGRSVISGGLTLAVLVLPIVVITAQESLRAVPGSIREAAYGVGATRWEVIRSHVLPSAAPGILTGTILSLARGIGETAPLILVGATTGFLSTGGQNFIEQLRGGYTALPMIVFGWSRERPDFRPLAAAAIVVLIGVIFLVNGAAILLRNRYDRRWG